MTNLKNSLDQFAVEKLEQLESEHLRRTLIETLRKAPARANRDGQKMISFCCNDYLGLSQHPALVDAATEAMKLYGLGSGASRLVTGNHPLFTVLERKLAQLKGTDDACVFGSGYLANIGIVAALTGPGDLVLTDELSHACLMAGARLSQATHLSFAHNDLAHCKQLLEQQRAAHRHCMILTDGVFSMDGDLAPVDELAALASQFDAWLMTDDAHGIGVVGGGRGSSFINGQKAAVPLQMGTLSKAVGSYGGYVCASQPVIDLIRNRARSLIYSTALPPAIVAASIAALDIIASDPDLCGRPLQRARQFCSALNLPPPESPIIAIILGAPDTALAASQKLEEAGFLVTAIRPPTVPKDTARLRITFSADHSEADVQALVEAIKKLNIIL